MPVRIDLGSWGSVFAVPCDVVDRYLKLASGNALKVLLILIYTFGALVIFIWYDLVDWRTGLILACGNMAGAWIRTRLSVKWGAKYIRYILLIALIMVALKLFGIF